MTILSWIGRKIGLLDGEFWKAFYNNGTWAGESITPDTAMQISAFWACVRVISQTIGTLPLIVYEKKADGSREARPEHPLYSLIHDMPNADSTAVEFWEGVAVSLCMAGNFFGEKKFNSQGALVAIEALNPDWMDVRSSPTGPKYTYRDPKVAERIIGPAAIFHIKGFGMGGMVGLSPITFARQSLSAARAADRAAATIFSNGMRPSGWLVYKGGTLSPEQREQAKKVLIDPMSGAGNTGKTGILEADFDYKQMTLSPEDSQMLESRQFNVEDVCRWLGVPPILIGHASAGQTMWGSGVEQILLGWLTLGLRPYLTRIEQSIKRSLILPQDRIRIYAEFSVEGLLRADSAGRATFYSTMVQNGLMTRNEARAKENLAAKDGGDILTVQSNLTSLAGMASGVPDSSSQQIRSALRSWLSDPEEPKLRLVSGG